MGKKSKVSKLTSWDIRDYLKAIHRTHILYDCESLKGKCVSYKDNPCDLFDDRCKVKPKELVGLILSRSNGLEKKGGDDIFMKRAVLDRLSTLAKRIVGNEKFALEEFLVDYEKVYNILTGQLRSVSNSIPKKGNMEYYIFDYLFLDKKPEKKRDNSAPPQKKRKNLNNSERAKLDLLKRIEKGYGRVATISILIILKVLPPFKGNNYKKTNIREDFDTLYDFCMNLKSENIPDSLVPEMLLFKVICLNFRK